MGEHGWGPALAALERQLDQLEHTLDGDAWHEPPELADLHDHGPVPAELVPLVQLLATRIANLEQRMAEELSITGTALRELTVRRRAAHDYQRNERTPHELL